MVQINGILILILIEVDVVHLQSELSCMSQSLPVSKICFMDNDDRKLTVSVKITGSVVNTIFP